MNNYANFPIIISGPSASGKSEFIDYVKKKEIQVLKKLMAAQPEIEELMK